MIVDDMLGLMNKRAYMVLNDRGTIPSPAARRSMTIDQNVIEGEKMRVYGLQDAGQKTAGYAVRLRSKNSLKSAFGQSGINEQGSSAPTGGYHGTLKMGYLYSGFSPVSGQELHMKYDLSSTDEDPVMYVEGTDIHGKSFTTKIHLNDVDASHATPAELTALRVHLAQQGDERVKASSGIPLMALSSHQDVDTPMDLKQYYEDWASSLANAGYRQNAGIYMSELERYLFYHRTKGGASPAAEDTSPTAARTAGSLAEEDLVYLSSNWDPKAMSQDDYDRFLDFLQSKGILSEEDKKYLDYGGETRASLEPQSWYTPYGPPVHDHADGDLSAFVRYQSSLIYEPETAETRRQAALYKKVASIMEKMA